MVINTNVAALASADQLEVTQSRLAKSLSRLSSGNRIVSPADDAAGLAVALKMDSSVLRTGAANTNVTNAISFTQTQDGYLQDVTKALRRMGELAILAQDPIKTDSDRAFADHEFQQLTALISATATKDFNGVSLFSASSLAVTVDGDGASMTLNGIDFQNTSSFTATLSAGVGTTTAAVSALSAVKAAINEVAADRSMIGAYQSRLNYTSQQLTLTQQNLTAASSRIEDVDVAQESTEYAKLNILLQSGTAMLAQANQVPQSVLKLIS